MFHGPLQRVVRRHRRHRTRSNVIWSGCCSAYLQAHAQAIPPRAPKKALCLAGTTKSSPATKGTAYPIVAPQTTKYNDKAAVDRTDGRNSLSIMTGTSKAGR